MFSFGLIANARQHFKVYSLVRLIGHFGRLETVSLYFILSVYGSNNFGYVSGELAEAAFTELRKKGLTSVSKKASRVATEGLLALCSKPGLATIIELNSETDFVARNDIFQHLVNVFCSLVKDSFILTFCLFVISRITHEFIEFSLHTRPFHLDFQPLLLPVTTHECLSILLLDQNRVAP